MLGQPECDDWSEGTQPFAARANGHGHVVMESPRLSVAVS